MTEALCCQRENEVLDALGKGFVSQELREHIDSCAECHEVSIVAGSLLNDRADMIATLPVPTSDVVLWKIKARERRSAAERARRSLLVGQAISLTAGFMLIAAVFGVGMLAGFGEVIGFGFSNLLESVRVSTTLWIIFAAWLVVAPVAGILAITEH